MCFMTPIALDFGLSRALPCVAQESHSWIEEPWYELVHELCAV